MRGNTNTNDTVSIRRFGCRRNNNAAGTSPCGVVTLFFAGMLVLSLLLITPAAAHVPLTSGGNAHIDDAFPVADPTKSWVVYGALSGGGDVRYYRMDMEAGDELRLSLFTPEGAASFVPGIVVTGPGLPSAGALPPFVEMPHPDGGHHDEDHMNPLTGEPMDDAGGETAAYGAVVIEGTVPAGAEFEPFTPSALYPAAGYSHDVAEPGVWYVAIYAPETSASGGNFGLAVGYREEFTLSEWLLVPFSVLGIHRWEGQSWMLILGPLAVVMGAGFGLIFRRGRQNNREGMPIDGPFGWLTVTAGLLFLGTGVMLLVQTLIALSKAGMTAAAILPAVYITAAVLLGAVALRAGLHSTGWGIKTDGVLMAVVGIVALVVWAGLLIGPACAIAAGAGALVWGRKITI
ncbi:hypothetical protein L1S32_08255 [Methanogenium sp. S4BF]|uniref:hypothetical protein n=1 Tax=Methanogenium sp. S4BF TaxID=1789226 RepID=UPI0024174293|nr:hypothetical protein [Methanogenium sp. S4BF]WFN33833.1 hypothetical protein L1S32_08255 [Methanogenium sp. S4BF]